MRTKNVSPRRGLALALLVCLPVALLGFNCPGLNPRAIFELKQAGVSQYLGEFEPATSEDAGDGWTKHTFDTDGGDGPICIEGSPFTVFTKPGVLQGKVVMFLNGGGACWQDFYFCSPQATQDIPEEQPGIFSDSFDPGDGSGPIDNPFKFWSKVFVSYCDGSVFSGDNDVADANFPLGPVRYHRGLRNLSAAMDVAKAEFPWAHTIMVSGASAGGVGAAGFAPFLARFTFGNWTDLTVFNDAGPIVTNPNQLPAAIQARANDWQFGQFYPTTCTDCDPLESGTAAIRWRLRNDSTIRESFYSTDGDAVNRFFLQVPTQEAYRDLIIDGHQEVVDEHPDRYKRFIRSGDNSHTALGTDLFYEGEANGTPLYQWTSDFVEGNGGWTDIVEDFVPLP